MGDIDLFTYPCVNSLLTQGNPPSGDPTCPTATHPGSTFPDTPSPDLVAEPPPDNLFTGEEHDTTCLQVNKKWLHHLQERKLSDEGHPRKTKSEEDPTRVGLSLEWVFGFIVSTAEKARDGAHRCISSRPPTARTALDMFT